MYVTVSNFLLTPFSMESLIFFNIWLDSTNPEWDLFIKSIHFFEDQGLEFDSFTCNKLLDIVNKYLKEDGYLDFIVEFMEYPAAP